MKFKKLLILSFLFFSSHALALDWQIVHVARVIDTEHLLLRDERVVKIIGFDGPDINFPTLQERSSARKTFQLMKLLLNGKQANVLKDKTECEHGKCKFHIKMMDGDYLVENLLKQGLGKFKSDGINTRFDKKYQDADSYARKQGFGQWGDTAWQKSSRRIRKIAGVATLSWRKKFGHYLAPISIGRVMVIENGNTFYLENGLCVKLLGVESPTPEDSRRGHSCFGKKSKKYLASLIMGKKVELRRDISQLDSRKCLLRHVWLQGGFGKLNADIHVNEKIISSGYGKENIPKIDKKYHKEFFARQLEVYENPRGAWLECAREIIAEDKPRTTEKKVNPNCPIKLSSTGKYHTPASSWYSRLNSVRCFEREEDAIGAGFEKAN